MTNLFIVIILVSIVILFFMFVLSTRKTTEHACTCGNHETKCCGEHEAVCSVDVITKNDKST